MAMVLEVDDQSDELTLYWLSPRHRELVRCETARFSEYTR
jgi:hypothetical protein